VVSLPSIPSPEHPKSLQKIQSEHTLPTPSISKMDLLRGISAQGGSGSSTDGGAGKNSGKNNQ